MGELFEKPASGRRVIVVDDEQIIADTLVMIFK